MSKISLLRPEDPPDRFPDPAQALAQPDGLLAAGGDLSPARLLAAYRRGIFPWFEADQPILWWSPDPRAILLPDELHLSRSLRRRIRSDRYAISADLAFGAVIAACAETRRHTGTWITDDMRDAYCRLHDLGYAHSIEIWSDDSLVGGLYGIALGSVFFGESMWSGAIDASKIALCGVFRLPGIPHIQLLDCQLSSQHLRSLGSRSIERGEFIALLRRMAGAADDGQADPPRGAETVVRPTPKWSVPAGPTSALLFGTRD